MQKTWMVPVPIQVFPYTFVVCPFQTFQILGGACHPTTLRSHNLYGTCHQTLVTRPIFFGLRC